MDRFAVSLTVFEGQKFQVYPKSNNNNSDTYFYIQARLNTELLTTDPVLATTSDSPIFDTELAWELDEKSLKYLKSQRSMIKVQCFRLNHVERVREQLGYVMLDLRQATETRPAAQKWISLLPGKSVSQRVELKIAFCVGPVDEFPKSTSHPVIENVQSITPVPKEESYKMDEPIPQVTQQTAKHQQRFTVEIRTVQELLQNRQSVQITYSYPPLQISSDSEFSTRPPAHTYLGLESILPHSFCAYEFHMDTVAWAHYLDGLPLTFKMFDGQSIIATGTLDLKCLLKQHGEDIIGPVKGRKRCWDGIVDMVAESDDVVAAKLHIYLIWEDFGSDTNRSVENENVAVSNIVDNKSVPNMVLEHSSDNNDAILKSEPEMTSSEANAKVAINNEPKAEIEPPGIKVKIQQPSETENITAVSAHDLKSAIKLERWKDARKHEWMQRMIDEEEDTVAEFAVQSRNRITDQNSQLSDKVKVMEKLELSVESVLKSLNDREGELVSGENLYVVKKSDASQSEESTAQRLSQHTQSELSKYRHELDEAQETSRTLELKKLHLHKQKEELETQLRAAEAEVESVRKITAEQSSTVSLLQQSILESNAERDSLVAQLEKTSEARTFYRKSWAKAIKDLLESKNKLDVDRVSDQKKKVWELGHMQKEAELHEDGQRQKKDIPLNPEVLRLENERRGLLQSGLYDVDDAIVRLIDKKVKELCTLGE